ncbi:MAG: glycosyltransferase [Desulfobacteraceae bacterium]|nr:glycosyltransferase [Desulfobacteraceae bacterium]
MRGIVAAYRYYRYCFRWNPGISENHSVIALNKVQTVINGVDIRIPESYDKAEKRRSLGLSDDDFVLGTVNRFYPEKNIEMQIRLVHALASEIPNLRLVVVAEHCGEYERINALVRQLNIENKVIFTGLRRDVPELLNIFDIFVMSSFSEGTSLALLEALSSGVVPVVSNVGGNSRIISHEDNGILFDVHDPESLKYHISELYHNPEKRSCLALRAEEKRKKYGIADMVRAYAAIYDKLPGQRRNICGTV